MIRPYLACLTVLGAFVLGMYDQYAYPTFGPDAVWSGGWPEHITVSFPILFLALASASLAWRKS